MKQNAVILFSGGQDSTTCLIWALEKFEKVYPIFFDYGQRHLVEKEQAKFICNKLKLPLKILTVEALSQLGGNSLTDIDKKIENTENNIPNSFVPGRNLLFLSLAAAYAYQLGVNNLIGGMSETDYSGYPDCREGFLQAAEIAINLAIDKKINIYTPLLFLTKSETWLLAERYKGLQMIIDDTHTCYEGNRQFKNVWGYGCGSCPSCILRAKGYFEAFGSN